MSSSLSVTTSLNSDNKVEITASVGDGGSLPKDVFVYENTGTSTLGRYIGVCNLEEYQRLTTFKGDPVPRFGNKFVKYTQAKIVLDVNGNQADVIRHITNTLTILSFAMSNSSSVTQIINIP